MCALSSKPLWTPSSATWDAIAVSNYDKHKDEFPESQMVPVLIVCAILQYSFLHDRRRDRFQSGHPHRLHRPQDQRLERRSCLSRSDSFFFTEYRSQNVHTCVIVIMV